MIITDLKHAPEQMAMNPALQQALAFLDQARSQTRAVGRVEIDGSQVFAFIQAYDTLVGEPMFEAHRQYLDLQYMVLGEEIIGWAVIDQLEAAAPYDEAKDVCLGHVPGPKVTPVRLSTGQLAVIFPSDAHAPKLAVGAPAPVKKIVVKVAVAGGRSPRPAE